MDGLSSMQTLEALSSLLSTRDENDDDEDPKAHNLTNTKYYSNGLNFIHTQVPSASI